MDVTDVALADTLVDYGSSRNNLVSGGFAENLKITQLWCAEMRARWWQYTPEFQKAWVIADQLLIESLSPVQCADYETHKAFGVVGPSGFRYAVITRQTTNVWSVVDLRWLCVIFQGRTLPAPDLMLMQKLLIQSDEARFRRIAGVESVKAVKKLQQAQSCLVGRQ